MKQQSKFLSLVLRHKPDQIGLTLGPKGWVAVDELLDRLAKAGHGMSRDDLDAIVATSDKKRFSYAADGTRIRAAQGHSVQVDLGLAPACPPDVLYHGTASRNLASIMADGLRPGARQQVHLSGDIATARQVGMRHGTPVVLQIDTKQMVAEGMTFYRADNGVWLTDDVPTGYLSLT